MKKLASVGIVFSKDKKVIVTVLLLELIKLNQSLFQRTLHLQKLESAKDESCSELGFVLGTEKHGDCVLKLIEVTN